MGKREPSDLLLTCQIEIAVVHGRSWISSAVYNNHPTREKEGRKEKMGYYYKGRRSHQTQKREGRVGLSSQHVGPIKMNRPNNRPRFVSILASLPNTVFSSFCSLSNKNSREEKKKEYMKGGGRRRDFFFPMRRSIANGEECCRPRRPATDDLSLLLLHSGSYLFYFPSISLTRVRIGFLCWRKFHFFFS